VARSEVRLSVERGLGSPRAVMAGPGMLPPGFDAWARSHGVRPEDLPQGLVVQDRGHLTCPACGSANTRWAVDVEGARALGPVESWFREGMATVFRSFGPMQRLRTALARRRSHLHPDLFSDAAWAADTFLCGACQAGWIEPDRPRPIPWLRPWSRPGRSADG
jgi:hypothetical protein